jgi:hypothetical protein
MKPSGIQRLVCVLAPLAVGLVAPSLVVFCVEVLVGNVSLSDAAADISRRQFSEGNNLFLLAAIGLLPFAVLSAICVFAARRLSPARLACLGAGGLVGILGFMIPSHVAVWYPLYGPGHASSTAVIAFLFIPFYCLGTLAIGLLGGWLVSRLPWFRRTAK